MSDVKSLVEQAENLFIDCDFPDKDKFIAIYNEFKEFDHVERDLNLRIHSLYFFLKIHDDVINDRHPQEKKMLETDTLLQYSNVNLNIDKLKELIEKQKIEREDKARKLIESRTEITEKFVDDIRKLVEVLSNESITLEEYYGKLCIYDHVTHEYHFIENDDDDGEYEDVFEGDE